jgi:glycosyltransferase involved in cell wall biosynthesis
VWFGITCGYSATSLYDGFGIGILEAMSSGVPAVYARAASLPETAEHTTLYFDPTDHEDMADRMVVLTTNREVYREYRRLGLELSVHTRNVMCHLA